MSELFDVGDQVIGDGIIYRRGLIGEVIATSISPSGRQSITIKFIYDPGWILSVGTTGTYGAAGFNRYMP